MKGKYTIIFYRGEPLDVTEEERNEIMQLMNDSTKKFVLLKRVDRVIMFGNICGIDRFGTSYGQEAIDMPYNQLQIEEPATMVKPETRERVKKHLEESVKKVSEKMEV